MKSSLKLGLLVALALLLASQAQAGPVPPGADPGINDPPPAGPVILDLNGMAVPHSYQFYTVNFIAANASTDLSFAFREDPAFLSLSNVTMTQGIGPNLVLNGTFDAGGPGNVGQNQPLDWIYNNVYNSYAAGVVSASPGAVGGASYYDGSVQAYDAITQTIATTVGLTYTVSFYLSDNGPLTTFSALSTNGDTTTTGGNGIDLLVYAGATGVTAATPEPASLALLASGLALLGIFRRRKVA